MILRTPAGASVRLGDELARGGEAVIHRVAGRRDIVAKRYTDRRARDRAKLAHMCAHPPADPARARGHVSIAWPHEVLLDGGVMAGFTMPYVRDAVALLEVFNPRRRARVLPGFTRAYLHRAGRNLASALAAVHAAGYVVGDLSEQNVLVTPSAMISLIDTDSFQVQHADAARGRIVVYPCPVGRIEYTPPELQGRALRDVVRRAEHDRFALGVLVFQLLMDGSHPFRGRWTGPGEPPPMEDKIAAGRFPHAGPEGELAPPPGTPPLESLHPDLAGLFVRCFAEGHGAPSRRPDAATWARALAAAERRLVACPRGHLHDDHLRRCPSCGAGAPRRPWRRFTRRRPPAAEAAPAAVTTQTGLASAALPRAGPLAALAQGLRGLTTRISFPGRVVASPSTRTSPTRGAAHSARGGVGRPGRRFRAPTSAGPSTVAPAGAAAPHGSMRAAGPVRVAVRAIAPAPVYAMASAAAGGLVAAGVDAVWANAPLVAQPTPAPPAALAALAAAVAFTVTAPARYLAATGAEARHRSAAALATALGLGAAGAGWAIAIAAVAPVALAVGALGASAAWSWTLGRAAGWTLAWAAFGATAGAVSVTPEGGRWSRSAVAAAYGAVGGLITWLAALAWGLALAG